MIKATLLQKPELQRLAFPGPAGIGLGKPWIGALGKTWDWQSIIAGVWQDERLLAEMIARDDAIGSSVNKLVATATYAGWNLRTESKTTAGAIAKRMIGDVFRSIQNMDALTMEIGKKAFLGWSPIQYHYRVRKGAIVPVRGMVQPAEQYWIDQEGRIVHFGGPALEAIVWEGTAALAWSIARLGATGEPYGFSPLRGLFPLYWIRKSLLEETVSKPVRLGPNYQANVTSAQSDPERRRAEVRDLLIEAAKVVEECGVWANINGETPLSAIGAQSSGMPDGLQVVNAIGEMIRFALTGEAASGAADTNRAGGKVAQQQLHQGSFEVAATIEETMNQLIANVIAINDWQFDPEDVPIWQLRASNMPNLQAVGILTAGGAEVDAVELADTYRVVLSPASPTYITGQVPAVAALPGAATTDGPGTTV